jgi:putative endonuclease
MWFVYIIYSKKIDRYYVGYTDGPECRLERHNNGWGKYTKRGVPWNLKYSESFQSKSEAIKREREIKRKKSRKYIEGLISHAGSRPD